MGKSKKELLNRRSFNVSTIYNRARGHNIPFNQLVKDYLNLTDFDEKTCFSIDYCKDYGTDNAKIFAQCREKQGLTMKMVANILGCSESLICYCEQGKRKLSDIRLLYKISKLFKIPFYVLVKNELGVTDEELAKVIKFNKDEDITTTSSKILTSTDIVDMWDDEFAELFKRIYHLSKDDLRVLVFMKIVFSDNRENRPYKVKSSVESFNLAKKLFNYLDEPPKIELINEILQLME